MRAYRVEVTERAAAELREAFDWIARDSPARAAAWRDELIEAAGTLGRFPGRCPVAPESGGGIVLRQLLHGNYRLLFTIIGDRVYVLHVRHAARRPLDDP